MTTASDQFVHQFLSQAGGKYDALIAMELQPGKSAPAKESTSQLVAEASKPADHIAPGTGRALRSNRSVARKSKGASRRAQTSKRKAATQETHNGQAKRQCDVPATCSTSTVPPATVEEGELSTDTKTSDEASRPSSSEPPAAANDTQVLPEKELSTSVVVTCRDGKLCAVVKPRISERAASPSMPTTLPTALPSSSKGDSPARVPEGGSRSEAAGSTRMMLLRPPGEAKPRRVRSKPARMLPARSSGIQLSLLTFLRQFMNHTPEEM